MLNQLKISLITSVLDELATAKCFTCNVDKIQSLKLIKGILKGYNYPINPNLADTTIKELQALVNGSYSDINKQLFEIANLSEKGLSELYTKPLKK